MKKGKYGNRRNFYMNFNLEDGFGVYTVTRKNDETHVEASRVTRINWRHKSGCNREYFTPSGYIIVLDNLTKKSLKRFYTFQYDSLIRYSRLLFLCRSRDDCDVIFSNIYCLQVQLQARVSQTNIKSILSGITVFGAYFVVAGVEVLNHYSTFLTLCHCPFYIVSPN